MLEQMVSWIEYLFPEKYNLNFSTEFELHLLVPFEYENRIKLIFKSYLELAEYGVRLTDIVLSPLAKYEELDFVSVLIRGTCSSMNLKDPKKFFPINKYPSITNKAKYYLNSRKGQGQLVTLIVLNSLIDGQVIPLLRDLEILLPNGALDWYLFFDGSDEPFGEELETGADFPVVALHKVYSL